MKLHCNNNEIHFLMFRCHLPHKRIAHALSVSKGVSVRKYAMHAHLGGLSGSSPRNGALRKSVDASNRTSIGRPLGRPLPARSRLLLKVGSGLIG